MTKPTLIQKLIGKNYLNSTTKNNFKAVVKNVKHNLKIGVVASLISASILTSLFSSCSPLESCFGNGFDFSLYEQQQSSQEQIDRLAKDLNCDNSIMKIDHGEICRLAYNDNEPIYITFENDFPQEFKEQVINSLDFIFGLVGEINPLYYYEVVDDYNKIKNKANIRYATFKENTYTNGRAEIYTYNNLNCGNTIKLNKQLLEIEANNPKNQELLIYNTCLHELLHVFGLNDVYNEGGLKNTENYYGNTFLQNAHNLTSITPNDYKCLLSAYAPEVDTNQNYYTLLDNMSKKASKFAYQYYLNRYQSLTEPQKYYHPTPNQLCLQATFNDDKGVVGQIVHILTISDDTYTIEIYKDGCIIETHKGIATHLSPTEDCDSIIILQNFTLSNGSDIKSNFNNCKKLITDVIIRKSFQNEYFVIFDGQSAICEYTYNEIEKTFETNNSLSY